MFDHLTMLQIDMIACRIAIETDDTRAPIEVIDDAIVAKAIAQYFSACEEWSDDLAEPAMRAYQSAKSADDWALGIAHELIGRFA